MNTIVDAKDGLAQFFSTMKLTGSVILKIFISNLWIFLCWKASSMLCSLVPFTLSSEGIKGFLLLLFLRSCRAFPSIILLTAAIFLDAALERPQMHFSRVTRGLKIQLEYYCTVQYCTWTRSTPLSLCRKRSTSFEFLSAKNSIQRGQPHVI